MVLSLVELKPGQRGVIDIIKGGQGLQNQLDRLGIRPGKKVTKVGSVFRHGPVTINVDSYQVAIGYGKASRVMVEVVENEKNSTGG